MLTWIGDIDQGDLSPDGGFAIRRTSTAPVLNAGQNISFDILVRNGVYVESDFNGRCNTGRSGNSGGGSASNQATLVDDVQWNGGYIATFECKLPNSEIKNIRINFNYTGPGTIEDSWMLTRIGDIENGNIATGGGYALTTTNVNPYLSPGQEIQFEVLVRNAVLSGTHYDVDCVVE